MYYYRSGTYELKPSEQGVFGMEQVSAKYDELGNGVVVNHPDNGLLAGDRIRSRLKNASNPAEGKIIWLTDDYNALLSARLAEAKQTDEAAAMHSRLGTLAIVGSALPQLNTANEARKLQYERAFERIVFEDAYVRNTDKRDAKHQLEQVIVRFKDRGLDVPSRVGDMILRAADSYQERSFQIARQLRASRQRQENLRSEFVADQITRNTLAALAQEHVSIAYAPEAFLRTAALRRTKPGTLTVNNAWYHRAKTGSWRDMVLAQDGWERLYGPLMRPASMLANETLRSLGADPGFKVGRYALLLASLEDIIDLSMIGGDYDRLAWQLQSQLFKVEELLLNGEVDEKFYSEAKKAAQDYRFLLRYRTLPGTEPPEEWYGGLPTIPPKANVVTFPQEVIDDPFHGLVRDD